ncbi:hypothetical protein [Peptococcus niger]|uniref:Uncharacterized protein n=1 Tax=Peptococcus niger TaxID=2741 RepID=A0A1G6TR89_PEPNI|nr:hypothetical protein [Peptococcus niger]SDD30825.1 hypothetical protein SAMN04489866_102198 [Peptococcus niger]
MFKKTMVVLLSLCLMILPLAPIYAYENDTQQAKFFTLQSYTPFNVALPEPDITVSILPGNQLKVDFDLTGDQSGKTRVFDVFVNPKSATFDVQEIAVPEGMLQDYHTMLQKEKLSGGIELMAAHDFTRGMSMQTLDPAPRNEVLATTYFYLSWNRNGNDTIASASQHPNKHTKWGTTWYANGYSISPAPGIATGRRCLSNYYNYDFASDNKRTDVTHSMTIQGLSNGVLDCHGTQIQSGDWSVFLHYRIACNLA